MSAEAGSDRSRSVARWFHAALTALFLALVCAISLTRSVVPVVLGRYSTSLFAYQLFNLFTLGLLIVPARRTRGAGLVLAVVSTFVAPINEAVRHVPGILAALASVRLLAGMTLIALEFDRFRRGERTVRGMIFAAGLGLAALSVLDLALWAAVGGIDEDYEGYRDRYDLRAVTANDIVLVGDSFVWGHGVPRDSRFGDVLERLYAHEGRHVKVYSLGVRGAGPSRYVESLARVPADRRIGLAIFAFYPNDLEPRPRRQNRALAMGQAATWTLGRSSLAFRACHDLLGKIETPSVAAYHRSLVDDYRRDDPTFDARWTELQGWLARFAVLSSQHSSARPLLLILPLMVDYRAYPLDSAHEDLAAAARARGFDVLDLLPEFRARLGDGSRFRVGRNDNHFDARVHALVAEMLKRHLDGRAESARLGRADEKNGTP